MSETQPTPNKSPAGDTPAAGGVTQATLVRKAAPKSDYKPADVSPQRRVQRS